MRLRLVTQSESWGHRFPYTVRLLWLWRKEVSPAKGVRRNRCETWSFRRCRYIALNVCSTNGRSGSIATLTLAQGGISERLLFWRMGSLKTITCNENRPMPP